MRRHPRRGRGTTSRLLLAAPVALLVLSGCSDISAQMQGAQVSSTSSVDVKTPPILVTQQWGVVDGMLSVVVTNTSSRTLRFANAVITATDANGVVVATSRSTTDGSCCAVVDLPPGARHGFYFDAGSSSAVISKVDVSYREVAWAAPSTRTDPEFTAQATGIEANSVGAVVVADVTTKGGPVAQVNAQAFLTDADGAFIAVVSGRWNCFVDGTREIRMQLFHPVPEGTKVESVAVRQLEHDPARTTPSCGKS